MIYLIHTRVHTMYVKVKIKSLFNLGICFSMFIFLTFFLWIILPSICKFKSSSKQGTKKKNPFKIPQLDSHHFVQGSNVIWTPTHQGKLCVRR